MKASTSVPLAALRAAFPYTVPILAGFLFLGLAYGIYTNVSGFSFLYPMAMSAIIFGGSLEFIATALLLAPLPRSKRFCSPSWCRDGISSTASPCLRNTVERDGKSHT